MDVSRETLDPIDRYLALLERWNGRIRLTGSTNDRTSLDGHIADSECVAELGREYEGRWVDLGSGNGFPAIAVAMSRTGSGRETVMVDSDARKCAFLRTVLRELAIDGSVLCGRIEMLPPQQASVVSAKALADMPRLLEYAERHLVSNGVCLFPKGLGYATEVEAARRRWSFDLDVISHRTGSVILRISGLGRAA